MTCRAPMPNPLVGAALPAPGLVRPLVMWRLRAEKLLNGDTNVPGDLSEQQWRNVTTPMKRKCRRPAIGVSELLVGSALPRELKAQSLQPGDDLPGPQDWNISHGLADLNRLHPDELGRQLGLAVLEKHRHDFLKVLAQFVQALALRMCAWPAGDVSDVVLSRGIALNHRGIEPHWHLLKDRHLPGTGR